MASIMWRRSTGFSTPVPLAAALWIYPDDQAVGYLTGDLRGAVSVRVALGG